MGYEAVECFWVAPTGKSLRTLRRYSRREAGGRCVYGDYHNASVEIGVDFDTIWTDEDGAKYVALVPTEQYEGDERWPTHCECGYEFLPEDEEQVNQEPLMAGDGKQAWVTPIHGRRPTPGAMFDTYWRPELRKEDMLAISVVCPNGDVWCIDDQASSGGYWTREGRPPKITVTPSIVASDYHGFLKDGILTASL